MSVCGISTAFAVLSPTPEQVHTCSSAVRHSLPEGRACDLHALGTPPAFILSQDQTLQSWWSQKRSFRWSPRRPLHIISSTQFSCEGTRSGDKKPGLEESPAWRRFRGEPGSVSHKRSRTRLKGVYLAQASETVLAHQGVYHRTQTMSNDTHR